MNKTINIISTSRMLLDAMRQASMFVVGASLLLMQVALLGNCMLLPPVIDSATLIFILLVIVPCYITAIVLSGCRIALRVKAADPMRLKLHTKAAKYAHCFARQREGDIKLLCYLCCDSMVYCSRRAD